MKNKKKKFGHVPVMDGLWQVPDMVGPFFQT
jgi:hypothetical protein